MQMFPIWRGYVKRIAQAYLTDKESSEPDALRRAEAVEAAIKATEELPDGKFRMTVINLCIIKQSHSVGGAAMQVYVSERTVERWIQQFLLEIGKALDLP